MPQLQRLAIAPDQRSHNLIRLTEPQQHYLGRVLRLRSGDRFIAMDGQGHWWLAELEASPEQAHVVLPLDYHTELATSVILLVAMPKGNGMDEIVRQTTELGVATIVPVISRRTLLKPSPTKCDRWQRIAQEAAEQSERQLIPTILEPLTWSEALIQWNSSSASCYLCAARGNPPHLFTQLQRSPISPSPPLPISPTPLLIATGPEGGWTDDEIDQAIAAGYQPVSLGKRILRAVTAPVVAMSLVAAVIETHSA